MIVRNIKIPKIEVIAAWSTAQNLFVMSSNNVVYKLFQDEFKQSDQRVNQTVVETEDCSYMNMIVSGSLQTQQKHLFIKNMKHYVLCNNHLYKLISSCINTDLTGVRRISLSRYKLVQFARPRRSCSLFLRTW
ncbi:Hypothetical_protein [Hexamita inflata]|uniref:Hypothetical_protein n=1 Tax=Hexamita inflata TaxID=28002 RepID=A0AA86TSV6_9EUKA|nr:Hypothetical protein HINF_LOCUS15046 [Hexamita inflata]